MVQQRRVTGRAGQGSVEQWSGRSWATKDNPLLFCLSHERHIC